MLKYLAEIDPQSKLTSEAMRNAALLSGLRVQATYCLSKSIAEWKHHFPNGIHALPFPQGFIPQIRVLYRLFGFAFIEKTRIAWRRLRRFLGN